MRTPSVTAAFQNDTQGTYLHCVLRSGILLLLVGLVSLSAQTHQWQIECVDCPRFFTDMTNRSIAIDCRGYPHIVYGGDHLYHAWCDNTGWHTEVVDDSPGVGRHASFFISPSQCLHVVYSDWPNRALKYALHDRKGWRVESVATASSDCYIRWPSVAVDASGCVQISYHDAYDYRSGSFGPLFLARRYQNSWQTECVDSSGTGTGALCLGPTGHPRILYDYYGWKKKLAACNDSGWIIETLPQTTFSQAQASLAVDGFDRPHIAMEDFDAHPVYLYRDEMGWHAEIVNGEIKVGGAQSLVLDREGDPMIAFLQWDPTRAVCVARKSGGQWLIEATDSTSILDDVALSMSPTGVLHICYTRMPRTLVHATLQDGSFQMESVDRGKRTGLYLQLALDCAGNPHLTYADSYYSADYYASVHDLWYARKEDSAWSATVVPEVGYQGHTASLALDGSGGPHLAFAEYEMGRTHHLFLNEGNWQDVVVASNTSNSRTAITADVWDRAHLAWAPAAGCGLGYACEEDAGWHIETVDPEAREPSPWALGADVDANPHITYSCWSTGLGYVRRYGHKDAQGWHIEAPPEWTGAIGISEPAPDEMGWPHVVTCHGWPDSTLRYSFKDGTGWHTEVPVSHVSVRGAISLALNSTGYPRITYNVNDGNDNLDLWFAWKDSQGWHTEPVVTEGSVGRYSKLAIDPAGVVHIAYYDLANEDLMYATMLGVACELAEVTSRVSLRLLGPVPCAGSARIMVSLPSPTPLELSVFDLLGRRVRLLARGSFVAGTHLVTWDGLSDTGARASTAVYIGRARMGDASASTPIILLR